MITFDVGAEDIDPPVWSVHIQRDGEEQIHPNVTFQTLMGLLIVPLGPVLNRPEQKFVFEVYRAGVLRLKIESVPEVQP